MGGVLFFDLSPSWCGYCGGDGNGAPTAGAWLCPEFGEDLGAFACYLEDAFGTLIDRFQPAHVGYERPLLLNRDTLLKLRHTYGMGWELERVAMRRGLDYSDLSHRTIKHFTTGDEYAEKRHVYAAMKRLGIDLPPKDEGGHDAGDASGGWLVKMVDLFPAEASPWLAKHRGSLI